MAFFLTCSGALAAVEQPWDPYAEFVKACSQSFQASPDFGKQFCECAAQESKSQHVKVARLKQETEKIKADPKYKIQDPGLLASIRYCSMKTTEGFSPGD